MEHFTGPFAVVRCDQRGMNIYKIMFPKETVDCIGCQRADAEDSLKGVGAWTQMWDCPQVFQCVPFLLKWIIRRGSSFNPDGSGVKFKRLLGIRCSDKLSGNDQCGTNIEMADLLQVVQR